MKHVLTISALLSSFFSIAQKELQSSYTAGDIISFTYPASQSLACIMTHSYGVEVVPGIPDGDLIRFTVPRNVSNKKGTIHFQLLANGSTIWQSETSIAPASQGVKTVEAYCGPKHLVVNKSDFTMLTASALDEFDNPFPEKTKVEAKALINNQISTTTSEMNGLIAFERIYAPSRSGYGAVSARFDESSTKEFRLDFYANDPMDFQLYSEQQHNFADGNQLVRFHTSKMMDPFGNPVENGTLVTFEITDSNQRKTIAFAETINGVAEFELPAPSYPTQWKVQASVQHYVISNIKTLTFKASIKKIPVRTTHEQLIVGPLKSFMDQHVREGLLVTISLRREGQMKEFQLPTQAGMVVLDFNKQLLLPGNYDATVEVGGLSKTLKLTISNE